VKSPKCQPYRQLGENFACPLTQPVLPCPQGAYEQLFALWLTSMSAGAWEMAIRQQFNMKGRST
jgi:hypothetical protein